MQINKLDDKLQQYAATIRNLEPSEEHFILNKELTFIAASRGILYSLKDPDLIGKDTSKFSSTAMNFHHDYKKIAEKMQISTTNKFNYILLNKINGHVTFGIVRITKIIDQNNQIIGFINLITRIRYCVNIVYMISNSAPSSFIQINSPTDEDRLNSPLDEVEQIICWLLTLNKSLKEISFNLEEIYGKKFPTSTLSSIIYRKILIKLNVETFDVLLKHLYKNSILSSIPQKLFTYLTDK